MKATIQTQYLREMIDAITAVVTEFRLHVQEDGITMVAVDTQNVALVLVTLPSHAFKSYEVTPGELGIDATQMKEILKDMPDALVHLEVIEGKEILLDWTPPGTDWFDTYQYSVKILETASIWKDPNPPKLDPNATVDIPREWLLQALITLSHHTEKVTMILSEVDQMFSISGSGDTVKVRIQGPVTGAKVTARAIYSLDYLLDIVKAIPCGEMVHIAFAEDNPVRLAFKIAGGHGNGLYMQAPRIETE